MRKSATVSALVCVCVTAAGALWAQTPARPPLENGIAPSTVPGSTPPRMPLFVRVVIDSLYCEKESRWDHGSSQDEPYAMILPFASHRDPKTWSLGKPQVFADVDSGNNRRFTKQERVVYEGPVPPGEAVGFHAVLWERDNSPEDTQYNLYQQLCRRLSKNTNEILAAGERAGGTAGKVLAAIYGLVHVGWISMIQQDLSIVSGGGDDRIAEEAVVWDYDDLAKWASSDPAHRAFRMILDGGTEGKYWLRYHVEFLEDAVRELDFKFAQWDDIAGGNMDRVQGDELVVVRRADASAGNGRFFIYNGSGQMQTSFDAPYAQYDRIAVADVTGNGVCEILIASPQGGGLVRIYDASGKMINRVNAPFARHDGFAAGDLNGDGKAEIVTASASEGKVRTFSSLDGKKIDEFGLDWPFKGCRYHAKDTRHDILLVGDVLGDSRAEIVMIENKDGTASTIRTYDSKGKELRARTTAGQFGATFRHYDAAALGNLYGDAKKELILATNEDAGSYAFGVTVASLAKDSRAGSRSWPYYHRYSGLAAGNFMGGSREQIAIANGSDGKIVFAR